LRPPKSVQEIVADLKSTRNLSATDFDLDLLSSVSFQIADYCEDMWNKSTALHSELKDTYNEFDKHEYHELVQMSSGALQPGFANAWNVWLDKHDISMMRSDACTRR